MTLYRLNRTHTHTDIHIYVHMHAVRISEERTHEFEGEKGEVYWRVWREETEGETEFSSYNIKTKK